MEIRSLFDTLGIKKPLNMIKGKELLTGNLTIESKYYSDKNVQGNLEKLKAVQPYIEDEPQIC